MVEDILIRRGNARPSKGGISSVSLTADSSRCGGSLLAALPAKPPLKGEVPAKRAEGFAHPNTARPRRLCQPPWTRASCKKPHPPLRRNQLRRTAPAKRQPLFGREREGGASLREAASLAYPRIFLLSRQPHQRVGVDAHTFHKTGNGRVFVGLMGEVFIVGEGLRRRPHPAPAPSHRCRRRWSTPQRASPSPHDTPPADCSPVRPPQARDAVPSAR